jgi:hypothetical protein
MWGRAIPQNYLRAKNIYTEESRGDEMLNRILDKELT